MACEWCVNPNPDAEPTNPDNLCDGHAAEYDGLTLNQFERRDREQYAEYLDAIS